MRRLWLRWALLIIFVLVLGVVFVNLGQWQLDRLAQRKERNAATIANEQKQVQPYEQVFTHRITDADQWQRVEARGTFDAGHQFIVRYRSNNDADGYEVVTPLLTASGVVLVDRGFIPLKRGTAIPSVAPAPPAGEVIVVGHVRRNEKGRRAATTPVDNQMRLINSDAIAATLPYEIKSGYIGLLTVQPEQQGGFQPIPVPELSEGPHFWYAVQWFMFTMIGVAGIVVFIRSDLRARREEREDAAEARVTV
ncbi:MAG TPA: SURF1 family protein [Propionibacteriaceae bacterium]|nr:SURF1 family protein [Propionibacteriaceae bacterium]